MENPRVERRVANVKVAGGVMAIVNGSKSVRLFTLGSSSRRIPYKGWEIPLPSAGAQNHVFYPGADVIAFVELRGETCVYLVVKIVATSSLRCGSDIVVHLRTLSSGGFHPSARRPTISYSRKGGNAYCIRSVSITSSQLAVLMRVQYGMCVVIWDWTSSQVLFVCQSSSA